MSHSHTEHGHRSAHEHVQRITDADESRSADMHTRTVKYTISMTVRLVCFIAAFFTHGPVQWVLLVGAVILPYFAVIIANAGGHKTDRHPSTAFFDPLADAASPHLPGGPARDGADREDDGAAGPGGPATGGEQGDGKHDDGQRDDGQQDDGDEPLILEGELYVPQEQADAPENPHRVPGEPQSSNGGRP